MSRYEFVLLRYVPDASSGEFANIGVVIFDLERRRLMVRAIERSQRLSRFFQDLDRGAFRSMVRHVEGSLVALNSQLEQTVLDDQTPASLQDLVRIAMPDTESSIQASPVASGVTEVVEARLAELFAEFVMRHEPSAAAGDFKRLGWPLPSADELVGGYSLKPSRDYDFAAADRPSLVALYDVSRVTAGRGHVTRHHS